jgi:hypothetical protein
MTWEDLAKQEDIREDLRMIPDMIKAGFTLCFNEQDILHGRTTPINIPYHGMAFKKGNIKVWECGYGGCIVWQVAELVNKSYEKRKGLWVNSIVYSNHRGGYGTHDPYIDRFAETHGFIPDLKTVLELDKQGTL